MTVAWLYNLAYLMDNPLVKLGWKPAKPEMNDGKNKLCKYLAQNPKQSFFMSLEKGFADQYGSPIQLEKWITKKKMMDGAWQHTYIEFDSRLGDLVRKQSKRWLLPAEQLEDLDPEHFIRVINYLEADDSVGIYVQNED